MFAESALESVIYFKSYEFPKYHDLRLGSILEYWFLFTYSNVHTYGVSSLKTPLWDIYLL